MAEQFLHCTQIGSTIQKMSRKCMPQDMRASLLKFRDCTDAPVDDQIDALRVHSLPSSRQEQCVILLGGIIRRDELVTTHEIFLECFFRLPAEWHDAMLGTFA